MPIDFDSFLKEKIIYYNPEFTIDDVIYELTNEEWEILAYRDYCILKKNKITPMMFRDVITNVKSSGALLFYVIDNVEIPIRDDTRIITALTPLKVVNIKATENGNSSDKINVTFTRLLLKNKLINELRKEIVFDSNFTYHGGEII